MHRGRRSGEVNVRVGGQHLVLWGCNHRILVKAQKHNSTAHRQQNMSHCHRCVSCTVAQFSWFCFRSLSIYCLTLTSRIIVILLLLLASKSSLTIPSLLLTVIKNRKCLLSIFSWASWSSCTNETEQHKTRTLNWSDSCNWQDPNMWCKNSNASN